MNTDNEAADIHLEHFCEHVAADKSTCRKWGCFGFEEAKGVMSWFCGEHQPETYRGLPAFVSRNSE